MTVKGAVPRPTRSLVPRVKNKPMLLSVCHGMGFLFMFSSSSM